VEYEVLIGNVFILRNSGFIKMIFLIVPLSFLPKLNQWFFTWYTIQDWGRRTKTWSSHWRNWTTKCWNKCWTEGTRV